MSKFLIIYNYLTGIRMSPIEGPASGGEIPER